MTVYFKGSHYPRSVILYAVFFYVRFDVSYRDLEEIMLEHGVKVDHATLNRWVIKYAPEIAKTARTRSDQPRNLGRWMKLISKLKENGRTFTGC